MKKYEIELFCKYHMATNENPFGADCSAHLADGRVFECPYKTLDDRNNAEYPCSDYKPVDKLKVTFD